MARAAEGQHAGKSVPLALATGKACGDGRPLPGPASMSRCPSWRAQPRPQAVA
jgi:hypothetical protein